SDSPAPGRLGRSPSGCPAGAMSLSELSAWLHWAGFSLLERRDYSPDLKELAARLVWELGSAEALADLWPSLTGRDRGLDFSFSYGLVMAAKGDNHAG
ncbi:hypothetical protein LJB86_05785, partial [Deltaproteobacteria bacterium OttesenSCG-928-M10]|nr:hypothetical protein [Deltaproteobacteria bacterium OttesenSCG-928-M10]